MDTDSIFRDAPYTEAEYKTCGLANYDENPLISSLEAIKTDDEWLEALTQLPVLTPSELAAPAHIRAYVTTRLKGLFVAGLDSLQLARRIDMLIRDGLVHRHPLTPERARLLRVAHDIELIPKNGRRRQGPISSYSLFGFSGMGKTTGVELVLDTMQQYIFHPKYHLHQIVWLKVETPRDGSVRELLLNILRAFDEVLGTNDAATVADRTNADAILKMVAPKCVTFSLGILIIDELQNLSVKKSGGREELLNLFQGMVNELRVPVVLMGTPKARRLFVSEMRHARRAALRGSAFWAPLPSGDAFNHLLDQVWDCLCLREAGKPTPEIQAVAYHHMQGIRSLMVDIPIVAQLHALQLGQESLTPELLQHVAVTEFALIEPFVAALRSKDSRRIKQFEDIVEYDFDTVIERNTRKLAKDVETGAEAARGDGGFVGAAMRNVMSTLDINQAEARELVFHVTTSADVPFTSAKALTQAVLKHYYDPQRTA